MKQATDSRTVSADSKVREKPRGELEERLAVQRVRSTVTVKREGSLLPSRAGQGSSITSGFGFGFGLEIESDRRWRLYGTHTSHKVNKEGVREEERSNEQGNGMNDCGNS